MAKSKINHERLDAVMSWAPHFGVPDTCKDELEAIQKLEEIQRSQSRRALHLQKHLDLGETICDCYETVRPLI